MEYIALAVLLFAFGIVLWSFREVRRAKLIAATLEEGFRAEIKERDDRIANMLKAQADDLRAWWLTHRQSTSILKAPPPPAVSMPTIQRDRPPQHNGILPRV